MDSSSSCFDNNSENVHQFLEGPLKITREIFSSSTDFNLEQFVFDVKQYIQATPTNKETISDILGVFSIVRPKHQELLTTIGNSISIKHLSMKNNFKRMFYGRLPYILELDTTPSPILEFIQNDDFGNLQEFVSNKIDFDFSQTFKIEQEYANLLDICAYYGSVQCFKYLVCNNAPFSEYVCPFSICGGNYEIIHYLENNFKEQNFDSEICLRTSIAYHRYEITDWLILNYGTEITDCYAAIKSFNFHVFVSFIQDHKLSSSELNTAADSGNLPIVQYLCEVAKVIPEEKVIKGQMPDLEFIVHKLKTMAKTNVGETSLRIACEEGHLQIVQYLCEVQKVNPESTDKHGRTALHLACRGGYLPVVQYLCEVQKVNTDTKDKKGWTALQDASLFGHLPIVKYLCEVVKVDTEGAYFWARSEEVKQYLQRRREFSCYI